SVGDVDYTNPVALVRNFVLFGGNDEHIAFYFRAPFVEIARIRAVMPEPIGLLALRPVVGVVDTSVRQSLAEIGCRIERLRTREFGIPQDDFPDELAPGLRRITLIDFQEQFDRRCPCLPAQLRQEVTETVVGASIPDLPISGRQKLLVPGSPRCE